MQDSTLATRQRQSPKPPTPRQIAFLNEAKARIAAHKAPAPLPDHLDSLTRRVAYQVDKHTRHVPLGRGG